MQQQTSSGSSSPARPLVDILHNPYTAWVVLLVSLAITIVAWKISNDYAGKRILEHFEFQVEEAQFAIDKRMTDYQQVLRGGLALFKSVPQVDRAMWRTYVESLKLNESYPGIQGTGFALWVKPEDKARLEQQVRAEGFPDFAINPAGERADYSTIIYLEPFDVRNRRAFGYDMYSEATRRAAMERARDSGEPEMTGKVKLVQEMQTDIQPGFLIYLPLYSKPVSTLQERRANLRGFVYSPFRIRDLMHGILGLGSPEVDFEIYDGETLDPEALLYDSNERLGSNPEATAVGAYAEQRSMTIAGHTWTVYYTSTPTLEESLASNQPLIVAIGGVAIDLLLFYIIISLARLRQRADRLAEERMNVLREQELHFKTIADTANDGIITSDASGEISYYNRAAGEIFGYGEEDLLETQVAILFERAAYEEIMAVAQNEAVMEGSSEIAAHNLPVEIDGFHRDGSTIPLELSVAGWRIGERQYATTIMRDISERKRIDRMKDEFISTVSHELRTPLTSIRGSLGLVVGGAVGEVNEKARMLVDTAARNCERLTRLINDILDVEKMASGKMSFDLQRHSTTELLEDAVEQNTTLAMEAGVSLSIDECDDAMLCVDWDRFQQVMTNLLANAIKFSPAEGIVTITCQQYNGVVRISVQDQGPGVPKAFQGRIFQKFAQADSSDTRQKGGTGLGLSIVRAIVEHFDGTVGYESEPGKGACFYFNLPVLNR